MLILNNGRCSAELEGVERFIRQHVRKVAKRPTRASEAPQAGFVVRDVAGVSVAAAARVQVGDLLHTIDGEPSALASPREFRDPEQTHVYGFYSPARREERRLAATGIPLGIELRKNSAAVLHALARGQREFSDLAALWEWQDWKGLESACLTFLGAQSLGRRTEDLYLSETWPTPASLLLGAARYERGETVLGVSIMNEFVEQYASHWTRDFLAIAYYYAGIDAIHMGQRHAGMKRLEEAFAMHPFDAIAEQYEQLSGRRLVRRKQWEGHRFPVDYCLKCCEGRETVGLFEVLRRMSANELLVVCLLSSFRANGPYSDFMFDYLRYSAYFADRLAGVHAITVEPDSTSCQDWWFEGEQAVREAGLPFELLHDEDHRVTATIQQRGSPLVLFLDAHGTVLHEGGFDEVAFWRMLERKSESTASVSADS